MRRNYTKEGTPPRSMILDILIYYRNQHFK